MAVSVIGEGVSEAESGPLIKKTTADGGVVDYKGRPVNKSNTGRWRSAFFIIGVEVAERFAYYGISTNLISYLTGPLGQSKSTAAKNVNTWSGVASLLPLLGAFVADSFLGRYRTIIMSSLLYILGLGLLTLLAVLPSFTPSNCQNGGAVMPCSPLAEVVLFFSLYLIAVAQGGHKPCVQAFGADQFDGKDPEECKAKSSFFNWWYLCLCAGATISVVISSYIDDNISWGLGFGIPCISMSVSLAIYLLGSRTYRYTNKCNKKNPFSRIGKVFAKAAGNWQTSTSETPTDIEGEGILACQDPQQFKFLYKALIVPVGSREGEEGCTINDVEEAKAVLGLVPVWSTCLVYAIVFAQTSTFFTEQGITMDRSIWSGFSIPAASLQLFIGISIISVIPFYDRVFVPLARAVTGKPSGITMLQRIGVGMIFSMVSMVVAALVETKRLETALEFGLVDLPQATVPMSIWWLVPQYLLLGIADAFTIVGMQEFFYDQVPNELRSVGLGLYLSVMGIGSFLSSFIISIIDKITAVDGRDGWFSDNLNRAHLDYYYWLLAALSALGLLLYLHSANSYIYR
ncbi:protein NRT1/ PTR FAMILY 5.10-like [Diospyros lotus]|uniref:protein NRT1/ PTR FAMILY 5.10-like n=1 Tax=Diospyros lotus TaxID=55363 RepID=UPI002258C5F1|nr:protein NRT1/ PTR FAMILY 5.10-like [Diospyros lotus]